MSLAENDRVMLYVNRAEILPTLAELSDFISSNLIPIAATDVTIAADVDIGVTADTLQVTISALAARIQALENLEQEIPV